MLDVIARINTRGGHVYDVMTNGEWHLVDHVPYPQQDVSRFCECDRCLKYNTQIAKEITQ